MTEAQPGIFAEGLLNHHHVEFRVRANTPAEQVVAGIAEARREATWLGGPNVTWGFAPALWATVGGALPENVSAFHGVQGVDGRGAPATQFDIWAWCSGASVEAVASTAALITQALAGIADLELSLPAYKTLDSRDPTGFVDGTANPLPDEAMKVALYPEGSVGSGGSAVLVQKWVHDLQTFEALPLSAQEDVIGRTKGDSVELTDDPPTSHVNRNTVVDEEGEERHIYRRNTPFNIGSEVGTMFIGCTNSPDLINEMLDRMFGISGDGLTDHLTRFSVPVTGSYYFVPAMADLTSVFGTLEPAEVLSPLRRSDLGIGSLLGRS